MSIVQSNIQVAPFACRDVIGVKGICDTVYPYNLDTLGISLNKASALADSSKVTGKMLVDESVNFAWQQVFSDLKIDGFKVAGVTQTYSQVFSETQVDSGAYNITLLRACDIERFFLNNLSIKVIGTLHTLFTIIYNGTTQTLYSGDVTDESLIVNIDNEIVTDKIVINLVTTGTGKLVTVIDNIPYNNGYFIPISIGASPINYSGYLECSEKLFFCKYWNYLVTAVMYKAAAVILNSSLFNDRYNDIIAYKKDDIALRIAQLDSTLNLLNPDRRINTKSIIQQSNTGATTQSAGLYQSEIEKLNLRLKDIAKHQRCTCCFNCDQSIQSHITIM